MVKKVCNDIKLYWSGWKYTVYKLLAYGYLNNLNKLGRYCDTHLKVIRSRSHISIQVHHVRISDKKYSRLYVFIKMY